MFAFDNTYARALEGTYVPWSPSAPRRPALVAFNDDLATELGLDPDALRPVAATLLSGAAVPDGATPIAQAYAGHQFGGLSPQLGDGRALLLGELLDRHGHRRDLQLKGSGRTPFSRGGDGKAALGPMLREFVLGEAMHALGVPTTRALAVTATGEPVYRDGPLPGAVLARVAASHLRVGTFEFFAIRDDTDRVRRLVTYALDRHFPGADRAQPALALLTAVRDSQASLVARWMGVGFIHGVMNTDNVAISGETLDYGPCAFLDAHNPDAVFSSIDHDGRYAYGNQPRILAWNLARFASALLPVIDPDEARAVSAATAVLDETAAVYAAAWRAVLRAKVGLLSEDPGDDALLTSLGSLLEAHAPDHTLFFRHLATAARGDDGPLRSLVADARPLTAWLSTWRARLTREGSLADRADAMDRENPLVIPRNHRVEEALAAAVAGDLGPFERLVRAVRSPATTDDPETYARPAPAPFTACYKTFCGT